MEPCDNDDLQYFGFFCIRGTKRRLNSAVVFPAIVLPSISEKPGESNPRIFSFLFPSPKYRKNHGKHGVA